MTEERIWKLQTWVGNGYAHFESPMPASIADLEDLEAVILLQLKTMKRVIKNRESQ